MKRILKFDERSVQFAVVDESGGMHFHVRLSDHSDCGIERHGRRAIGSNTTAEPTHTYCWLLEGPCWHDGSTLVAREYWLPTFIACNETGDFEPLWRKLETRCRSEFAA